jgi:hypothetical protein
MQDGERHFIIVTGPGRSGTSAVARVLHESGLRMGTDLGAPSEFNRAGFYEDMPVRDLNERIMAGCGMVGIERWPERDEVLRAAAPYREEMAALAVTGVDGWKDPRFCITLEAWLPHLPARPRVVVCLRSPEAFVHSVVSIFGLQRRDSLERWWANHLRRALDVVRDHELPAASVVYEDLIARPEETVARLASFVGHPLDARFVEPELRQFDQPVPQRHQALYDEVRALA